MGFFIVNKSKIKFVGGGEINVARRGNELDVRFSAILIGRGLGKPTKNCYLIGWGLAKTNKSLSNSGCNISGFCLLCYSRKHTRRFFSK